MTLDPTATVAQVVLDHPECARIFRSYKIDFCCRGGMSVGDACAEKGVEAKAVVGDLEQAIAERREKPDVDPRALATPELLDHIVARYHASLRKALPFVEQLALKVARVHGDHNTKLRGLADVVVDLRETLEPHLDEEERAIFPLLRGPDSKSERARKEVGAMQVDHLRVGELLQSMQALSDGYTVPEWGCRSYQALMRELEALEVDTLEHVHIENHVLAPRFAPAS